MDMTAVGETMIYDTRDLTIIFYDFEIHTFFNCFGIGGKVVVFFRKGLDLEIRLIFVDLNGNLVVLDVSNSEVGAFRLVAVYTPIGAVSQISSDA